jgi:hypothetical protein
LGALGSQSCAPFPAQVEAHAPCLLPRQQTWPMGQLAAEVHCRPTLLPFVQVEPVSQANVKGLPPPPVMPTQQIWPGTEHVDVPQATLMVVEASAAPLELPEPDELPPPLPLPFPLPPPLPLPLPLPPPLVPPLLDEAVPPPSVVPFAPDELPLPEPPPLELPPSPPMLVKVAPPQADSASVITVADVALMMFIPSSPLAGCCVAYSSCSPRGVKSFSSCRRR